MEQFFTDLRNEEQYFEGKISYDAFQSPAGNSHIFFYSERGMEALMKEEIIYLDDSFPLQLSIKDCKQFLSLLIKERDKVTQNSQLIN